ncbi:GrpE, mitochondrial [Saxophila tyrrhenica]|uniref:GrpE protein homolog, mitochondrial n=1 Tax=Saxophila tyrrhenica TaxID=1690608 RepID=A0AAV9PMN7_9PEZI|nr:GrpE, mitochondrial [Saxophila tyrrhenica]
MIQQRLSRSLQTIARQQRQCLRLQQPQTPFSTSSSAIRSFAPPISQRIQQRRQYASAQEAAEGKQGEKSSDGAGKEQMKAEEATQDKATTEDPVQKELEAKKKEVLDVTDKYRRQVADYRNLQEQTRREVQAAKDFALQRFSKDLLESIDNLDRALSNVPADKLTAENQDLLNLHSGLKMTETILMQTLKKHGLERVDPSVEEEKFDPNRHEAVFQAPQPGKTDGVVFHTQQKGFTLNGRVIRPPKVGVVRNG